MFRPSKKYPSPDTAPLINCSQLLDEIIPKMEQVFLKIVEDGPDSFDIERINNFIDRKSFVK